MSLKKRMFRSNMTILCSALVSLMLIIIAVLLLFEDSFEQQFHSISQTALERHASEAAEAVEQTEIDEIDELNRRIGQWGYQAVYFPEENPLLSSLRQIFLPFLCVLVLAGIAAIAVILLLASFFTRKMNRLVMEPVELLVAGAERIRDGNLNEEIRYEGEAEFEHVCRTFNAMQHTILEDQRQREKNEKVRTDMVTGISHDLRTPLTSIRGYIKGVLDGVADTDEKKALYLQTAYESTEDMNALLQKLFDFSRMESGQMPFHMVYEEVLKSRQIHLSFMQEKEVMPEVPMDVDRVPKIFDNLLENSVKYAGVSPLEIRIQVFEQTGEKPGVIVEWKDNGHGVPEEKLPQIFERFYRCDESRSEKGGGIGLYVVKYIMERHGGSAKAENDGGLKIQLFFPKEET